MTFDQLLLDPSFHALVGCCFLLTSAVKKALAKAAPTLRSHAVTKLGLVVIPFVMGAPLGLLFFSGASTQDALLAGAACALPAVAGYDALKQVHQIPGLPGVVTSVLGALLQRPASIPGGASAGSDSDSDSL